MHASPWMLVRMQACKSAGTCSGHRALAHNNLTCSNTRTHIFFESATEARGLAGASSWPQNTCTPQPLHVQTCTLTHIAARTHNYVWRVGQLGHRPGHGARALSDGGAVQAAGHRLRLSQGHQGLLHEAQ